MWALIVMALLTKIGSFQATTAVATTVIQVRSVGFQPKVVLFWWNGRDGAVDASGEADLRMGFGWMHGASNRHCATTSSDHAATVGECDRVMYDDAAIASIIVGTGDPQGVDGKWDFSAWDADGFDLIVDDAFATAFQVQYLALGGDDLRNVASGTMTMPASPGTLDIQPGFKPECIFLLGTGQATVNTIGVDGGFSVGIAHDTADGQGVLSTFMDDGPTTSDTASYCRGGECLAVPNSPTTIAIRASLSALLEDGFTLNFAETVARPWFWLAMNGVQCRAGTTPTSTTLNATATVSLGFEPRAVLFLSACRPNDASDTPSAHATMSIGAATSASARSALVGQDKDAIGTMDCFTGLEYDEIYQNPSVAAGQATEGLMDIDAFLAEGFRTIMDDADDAANSVIYLAFGDEVVPLDRRRARLWL